MLGGHVDVDLCDARIALWHAIALEASQPRLNIFLQKSCSNSSCGQNEGKSEKKKLFVMAFGGFAVRDFGRRDRSCLPFAARRQRTSGHNLNFPSTTTFQSLTPELKYI